MATARLQNIAWGIVGLLLFLPHFTSAQTNPLRLTTSPLPINLVTAPGTQISTPLRIRNDGPNPETLKLSLMKFRANDTNGRPLLEDPLPTDEFINWASFSEESFTVAPGEWKTITATFDVPESASFGYYYAVVFSRAEEEVQEEVNTAVIGGTAVLVLLEARVPNAIRNVEVLEFSVDKPWYEFLPVRFNLHLKNTGNVHIAPRGNIFISRGNTKDIAILEINERRGNLLPQSSRTFTADWIDGFPVLERKIEQGQLVLNEEGQSDYKLTWDFSQAHKLRIGKHTASMLLVYDNGERDIPIEGQVSFWVIPWRLLLAALAISLFALVGLYATTRPLLRRIFRRRRQPN